jgi:LysM repeat protein
LGCHRKHPRNRTPRRLPNAAAPALAGMASVAGVAGVAAALCLAPQALADPSAAHQGADHAVTTRLGPTSEQLLSVIEQATQQQATQQQATRQQAIQQKASGQPSTYTVKSGDSLSSIAGRAYHNQDAWPVLYWANRSKIHWANVIEPGQVLRIPVKPTRIPDAPGQLGAAPAPAAESAAPSATAQSTADASTYTGGGSFAQCVIARESGGNAQVMNASGHYGLYQFSASTWAAYGGSPADFGNASVAEQNQVFDNALAAGGQSNWSAYDGC